MNQPDDYRRLLNFTIGGRHELLNNLRQGIELALEDAAEPAHQRHHGATG